MAIDALELYPILINGDAVQFSPVDNRESTTTRSGNLYFRRKQTARFYSVSVKWLLDRNEMMEFQRIYEEVLNQGTRYFTLRVDIGLDISAAVLPSRSCCFSETPAWEAVRKGEYFEVSAKLRVIA